MFSGGGGGEALNPTKIHSANISEHQLHTGHQTSRQ